MREKNFITAFLAMAFLLTACIQNDYTEEEMPGVEITHTPGEGTFSRHLESIRQLAQTWDDSQLSEQEKQLHRLREFARNLNAGGEELEDLRITRIWWHRHGPINVWCDRSQQGIDALFDLTFNHADDFNNTELIEEMLAFAGISEEDIYINLGGSNWVVLWGQVEDIEFMLGNQAVYEFVRPYLRLREFAMKANSGTIYRDEAIITMVDDVHQQQPIGQELSSHFFPRYRIGISPLANEAEIAEEMLAFAGLHKNDVQFQVMDAHHWYIEQDFLRVNEEMGQFYKQNNRLHQFADLVRVRTVRRSVVMDFVMFGWSAAGGRGAGSGFQVTLSEEHTNNEELKETLLFFTGIDKDNIDFEVAGEFIFGWTPTRADLTPEQNIDLDALEPFKSAANAPFWHDRYLHDPVIVSIGLDGEWDFNTNLFSLTGFDIFLYDPDLLDLTDDEIIQRTATIKSEIMSVTGVENICIKAFRPHNLH